MNDLDLVNQALNECGQKRVTSLDNTNNDNVVATANFQLDRIKRAVLRAHDWNCARKRLAMDALDPDLSLGEWSQAFRLPPDCLTARRFVSTQKHVKYAKFAVESDPDDKKILFTNHGNNLLVYTGNLLDVNRWDALLFDACATRLAIQFAITIPRDLKFLTTLTQVYQSKMEETASVDEAEGGIENPYDSTLVDVRF